MHVQWFHVLEPRVSRAAGHGQHLDARCQLAKPGFEYLPDTVLSGLYPSWGRLFALYVQHILELLSGLP